MQFNLFSSAAPNSMSHGATNTKPDAVATMPVAPARRSLLRVCTDEDAIALWVSTKKELGGAAAEIYASNGELGQSNDAETCRQPEHTARAYEREAQRFLLWLRETRGFALAQATLEDGLAYVSFLANPHPSDRWCAPRSTKRGTSEWRPFAGPLRPSARRQALAILSNLYRFLQDHQYLAGNPFSGVRLPRGSAPRVDARRSLSRAQWASVEAELACLPNTHIAQQLAWCVRFLYFTGLRLAEAVSVNCSDLIWFDLTPIDQAEVLSGSNIVHGSWLVRIVGKGQRIRDVPVPTTLVDELSKVLEVRGWQGDLQRHSGLPVLVSGCGGGTKNSGPRHDGPVVRLSAQALYKQLKRLFSRVSAILVRNGRQHDADVLVQASTHWLRHSHGTHAIAAGVPLDVVRENLGHASLATTGVYVRSDLARRITETRRLASL